jgi:tRNA (mo5U34)-methyltransferase
MDTDELHARIEAAGPWWHSIELAPGVVTPGGKSQELLRAEVAALRLDDLDLRGKTVIDIGAWDGFYSFEAERRGAARVVALDHFIWSIDIAKAGQYGQSCRERGVPVEPLETVPGLWCPDTLPGKRGFDLAHAVLGSRVEPRVGDLMSEDPASIGQFDVALFLGVLYHLRNPLGGLMRLAALTREVAIIESHAILLPGHESKAFCEFHEGSALNHDPSNWWVPNENALLGMCRAAGFRKVERVNEKPAEPPPRERTIAQRLRGRPPKRARGPIEYRAIVHAWK